MFYGGAVDGRTVDDGSNWRGDVDALVARLAAELGALPYDPTPERLYGAADLYAGFDGRFSSTVDQAIYARAQVAGRPMPPPTEELAQRLHDHGIGLALEAFRAGRSLVGVMGGHTLARGSQRYRTVVDLGRRLALAGHTVTTGGGPGAMEAANLGAASAPLDAEILERSLARLTDHPSFGVDADGFVGVGLEVVARLEADARAIGTTLGTSLSVPTWFYGHEPTNPFASHIAKYFSNSERESGLLAVATAGIVFVPGGPGTFQEVFQDAAQNAYRTFGEPSPMVFLDPPDAPGWWAASGALATLDRVFHDDLGRPRPGRGLVRAAATVDEAIAAITEPS